jgi:hypothetical protein
VARLNLGGILVKGRARLGVLLQQFAQSVQVLEQVRIRQMTSLERLEDGRQTGERSRGE